MIRITVPYDPNWLALAWVKEHCPSYITNKPNEPNRTFYTRYDTEIDYFFAEEADAVLFLLRWS